MSLIAVSLGFLFGIHMRKFSDLVGKKFGFLVVIRKAKTRRDKSGILRTFWRCKCSCGKFVNVYTYSLIYGSTKSCKCLFRQRAKMRATKHGGSSSLSYQSWLAMTRRCKRHKRYFGRGITFNPSWKSFKQFFDDMGEKPSPKHSLGRIDNNGNYCKENCRWELPEQQADNKSSTRFVIVNEQKVTLSSAAKIFNVSRRQLYSSCYRRFYKNNPKSVTPVITKIGSKVIATIPKIASQL